MPFLAPVAGPLIGLGSSIISGLFGRKKASSVPTGSSASAQTAATPLLPPGLDQQGILQGNQRQIGVGDYLFNTGKQTFGQGSNTLQDPINFYQKLLSGDRTALMENLAPEIAAINQQFQAPLQQAALTGRETSLQPDLEASRQSAISNLFFQERPKAADALTGISQNLMNLGAQQAYQGGQTYGQANRDLIDYNSVIRGLQYQGSRDSAAQAGTLGESLGALISRLLNVGKGGGTPAVNLPGASNLPTIPFELPTPVLPGIDVSGLGAPP
jgi:uncharacterized protein YbjQ (UPF0145 family)